MTACPFVTINHDEAVQGAPCSEPGSPSEGEEDAKDDADAEPSEGSSCEEDASSSTSRFNCSRRFGAEGMKC